jgi:ABC-2 type transport system ATP-binding protein
VRLHLERDPAALSGQVADPARATHALAQLSDAGLGFSNFTLGQASLDEVFLSLTGRKPPSDAATEEEAA